MRPLLADILTRLDGLTIDPTYLQIEAHQGVDPIVTIRFATVADITNYAAADKATVKTESLRIRGGGHIQHYAMYERPGRRMLLQCFVFPHSPDWEATA